MIALLQVLCYLSDRGTIEKVEDWKVSPITKANHTIHLHEARLTIFHTNRIMFSKQI